jgi:hypothetical protein
LASSATASASLGPMRCCRKQVRNLWTGCFEHSQFVWAAVHTDNTPIVYDMSVSAHLQLQL